MADEAPLALFPVYLYEHGFEPPKTGRYYLVTQSGIYFHKETQAGTALVKVDGIPWLKEPTIEFRLKLPKIPARIIGQALMFFRKVWDEYQSEAYVTLMFSAKTQQYQLWCPKQRVSRASVNYDRTDQPDFNDRTADDWQMVGTIHSHCNFSAFHSGTDHDDESTFDGIHITLGHVDRKQFSVAASIAINDTREVLEPENCCIGVTRVSNKDVVKKTYMTFGDSCFFDLELSDEDAQGLVSDAEIIEQEWFPKVEHQTVQYTNYGNYYSNYKPKKNEENIGDDDKVEGTDEDRFFFSQYDDRLWQKDDEDYWKNID